MKFLVTNDDGPGSPLLAPLVRLLRPFGEVTVVIPDGEQSWRSKALTRYRPLRVSAALLDGDVPATLLDGTPADCVAYAASGPLRPRLVVSGINLGYNAGLGFIASSGTVGACLEANIAGVPGVAVSQALDRETRDLYVSHGRVLPETLQRLVAQAAAAFDAAVVPYLRDRSFLCGRPVTANVNIPFLLDPAAPVRRVSPARAWYSVRSAERGGEAELVSGPVREDPRPGTDRDALAAGAIGVSELDLTAFDAPPRARRRGQEGPLLVGLTGSFGSGKSTVAALFSELGAVVVDADRLAKLAVAPGEEGYSRVLMEFGPGVLTPEGELDRPKLRGAIAADPAVRGRLEAAVHPVVRRLFEAEVARAAASGARVVVYDVPLLFETDPAGDRFDVTVSVYAPRPLCLARAALRSEGSLGEAEAGAIYDAQLPGEEKCGRADHCVANVGTEEELKARVGELWSRFIGIG